MVRLAKGEFFFPRFSFSKFLVHLCFIFIVNLIYFFWLHYTDVNKVIFNVFYTSRNKKKKENTLSK